MIHRQLLSLLLFIVLFQSSSAIPIHTECIAATTTWPQETPYLLSPITGSNKCSMVVEDDGNLILYLSLRNSGGTFDPPTNVWEATNSVGGTAPYRAVIQQTDGNFVVYDVNDVVIWESGTHSTFVGICLNTNCDLYFYLDGGVRDYLYNSGITL